MLVYIVIGLLALTGLAAAYRSLGRAAGHVVDPLAVMGAVLEVATNAASQSPVRDAARASRRRFDAGAQQLERIDAAALDADASNAYALLVVAVEELSWWARLRESDLSGPGMQRAADALSDDALRCLDEARRALAASAVAEVGHGSL